VALLPAGWGEARPRFLEALAAQGIGHATYFSPHLAQHSYFQKHARFGALSITDTVASRVICLPMSDTMADGEIRTVIAGVRHALIEMSLGAPDLDRHLSSAMAAD
jgi:dTDP-4-amino-4,6-dideoxygalactose transaminase